jgi:hypothetical protein
MINSFLFGKLIRCFFFFFWLLHRDRLILLLRPDFDFHLSLLELTDSNPFKNLGNSIIVILIVDLI